MNAVPGCEAMPLSVVMFASLSGMHAMPGLIGLAGSPSGRGEDCVSHMAIPNQNAGCSWKLEGLRSGRDACRGDRIGRQGQDVLHAVPAPGMIRVEEKRRLIVADVRRERFEIVHLGAEVAADAALDVRVDVPGRNRCAGEEI